ncbi:hypothetical protein GOHSU_18_00940 [Gordonia hirsuta DSM 44140 = NBRC 16056]|uniref:Secreted protein n=1 Tax=Gordonia hirsuta DSM 44140 = NBRC 16056 TaxID=1121927 RepID=L7L8T1_9ACTN|nr:hypothetical protein [Gordonia hirsuta]GAC57339.1 hypothetical protein GOHSU_18_00940 [Gordonia hirsuta DSM 44140 = NBRC 16056]
MKTTTGKTSTVRRTLTALAASSLLLAGTAAAPAAFADPSGPSAEESLAAQRAIEGIEPTDAASVIDGIEAANKVLDQLGIAPFTPTLGFCTDVSFSPAIGGAIPGPKTPGVGDLSLGDIDLNAVKKGEVMFGFVPVGVINDSAGKGGMQVAWFNVNTFKGSLGDPMGGITDVILDAVQKRISQTFPLPGADVGAQALVNSTLKPALNSIPQAGVRGALVDTDAGTVLAAMYGTVKKGNDTCFYFPSMGIVTVS